MAPKKKTFSAFSEFMAETQKMLEKKGIKMSMADMPDYCKKDWEGMSEQMKEKYKNMSKMKKHGDKTEKYTTLGEKVTDVQKQSDDSKSQTEAMYYYIEELVRVHPDKLYLPKQKFILIHVNPYSSESEGFYFPAEVSMAEFSLEKGVIRTFHRLVGFDATEAKAPIACAAEINSHAKNNHLIDIYSKLSTNYTDFLLKIIGFIINKDVDEDVLNDQTLDMPPIYTAHSSVGNELMITNSSLYQLYRSAVKYPDKDDFNLFIKVYHLDKLFMELKNVSYKFKNPDDDDKAIPSVAIATDNFAKDMLNIIKSIGCTYHEKLEYAHVCSNFFVCKWIYILSTHCCQYFDIKLVSGCHFNFDLSKTEVPVDENFKKLSLNDDLMFMKYVKKNVEDLTPTSFPALDSKPSTVMQQPVWSRPVEQKLTTHNKIVSSKDDKDSFPPLGNPQRAIPENTPAIGRNNRCKNEGRGKGVNAVQKNKSSQAGETSKNFNGKKGSNVGGSNK